MSDARKGKSISQDDFDRIRTWNASTPNEVSQCVHELVWKHAERQPHALAVQSWDGGFSYSELKVAASNLARRLASLGVKKEDFVPICFEKSKWTVVALLSVLEAGAAAVFLDPAFPAVRLKSMIQDVDAKIILCSKSVRAKFESIEFEGQLLAFSASFISSLEDPSKGICQKPSYNNAAICLFTSGSTGKPKGIVQEHHTTALSAKQCAEIFDIRPGTHVLQWAAYCFDMSIIDTLMTLVGGGCVCIPSEEDRVSNLPAVMRAMRIECATLTPSFAQTIKKHDLPDLKTLIFGGEPVSHEFLDGWPATVRIFNGYGPAECSVCVAGNADIDNPANVGRPTGSSTWIVDENDPTHLLPIGEVGELLIEGPLLARGYLNDAAKTSRSFLENITWPQDGEADVAKRKRVYASGDLAKYEADGTITLKGRKDTQVKLRGQRIETAEVEFHMKQYILHDMTCVVTVVSHRGLEGTQNLVAFVTNGGFRVLPDAGQMHSLRMSSEEADLIRESLLGINAHLASSLPSYMIPSLYFPCAFIPTSMSSKIDRKILAEYGAQIMMEDPPNCIPGEIDSSNGTKRTLRATDGHLGEQLKLLWSKLLKRDADTLNPKDHFFNLGGDSIAATRLVNEAKSIGITVSVKDVFQNPTLEALAAIAVRNREQEPKGLANGQMNGEQSESHRAYPDNILGTPESRSLNLEQCTECPNIQAFMVVSSLLKARGYFTYFSFDISGPLSAERLEKACHSLVKRHSILRTVFDIQAGRIFQKVLKAYPLEFAQITSKETSSSLLARMCEAEKQCESRLGGTIVHFVLVKRGIDQHILIMRICHSQFDGHSLGVIYRDLQAAYQERLPTGPAASFSDFSKASSEANDHRAVSYWRTLLQGSSMTSVLKHSRPPTSDVINDRVTMHFSIKPPQLSEVTLSTIVKAAWGKVLAEFSRCHDVVFGYAVTTRNLPLIGIEEVVGPCNNAALARVKFDSHVTTIRGLLNQVQDQYLTSIPFESVGPRQMIEECTDWPKWTRYSTSVNHQNYADAGLDVFALDEHTTCSVTYQELESDRRDIQVYSWPIQNDEMKIALAFCDNVLSKELIQDLTNQLAANIQYLASGVENDKPLQLDFTPSTTSSRIPLALVDVEGITCAVRPRRLAFSFTHLDPHSLVDTVWTQFMALQEISIQTANSSRNSDPAERLPSSTPFYEYGGDLTYAAQLSQFYRDAEIEFFIEDLIKCPTREDQIAAIKRLLENE